MQEKKRQLSSRGPGVSVLMPVYNGEAYLCEAIESILNQTFHNLEFIIINDGSTDGTAAILNDYREKDTRIRLYYQENQGIIRALNRGLELALGTYIARMDADDISVPHRLSRQVAFMESNPRVGVCGTWVELIGSSSHRVKFSRDDATLRCKLLFHNTLAHPSVILRREVFEQSGLCYNPEYTHSEDYDLWVQAARVTELANIPEVLLHYRVHLCQVGSVHREVQWDNTRRIHRAQLAQLLTSVSEDEASLHESLGRREFQLSREFITRMDSWLRRLHNANQERKVYPGPEFSRLLGTYWTTLLISMTKRMAWGWYTFWKSPLLKSVILGYLKKSKLV